MQDDNKPYKEAMREIWGPDAKIYWADEDIDFSTFTEDELNESRAETAHELGRFQGPQLPKLTPEDWYNIDGFYADCVDAVQRKRERFLKRQKQELFIEQQGKLIDLRDEAFILDNFDLIEGLVPRRGRVGILGKYKAGKSVVSSALGLHIATGKNMGDRFVEQSVVVHVMSEGDKQRNKNRILAWCKENNVPPKDMMRSYIPLSAKYDLTKDARELAKDIAFYGGTDRVGVVIIDPLIENFRGNENSSEDMIAFMNNAHEIAKLIDGVVIMPHHTGMDSSRGARGSTAYEGAVDIVLKIENSGGEVKVKSSASRDGVLGDGIKGEIISHEIGVNNRDRPVSSPVFMFKGNLESSDSGPAEYKHWQALSSNQQKVVDQLYGRMIANRGKPEKVEFTERLIAIWPGDGQAKTKRQSINRTIGALIKKGVLAEEGTMIGLSSEFHRFWQAKPRSIPDDPAE